MRSLVFNRDEDKDLQESLGDANYFKLRELENTVSFVKQEIETLQKQEQNMSAYSI